MEHCMLLKKKDLVYLNACQLSYSLGTAQYNRASRRSCISLFQFTEGAKEKPGDTVQNVSLASKKTPCA